MNPDPDYSAAYVVLETSEPGLEGHGLTFTIGRGNELCVAAVVALAPLLVGQTLDSFTADMGAFWRRMTGDSQLRWVGPEKGVIHLATAAVVNAVWDLWAKSERKPVWRLLCEMTPEEIVPVHRLPVHHRRAYARRSIGDLARSRAFRARNESRRWSAMGTLPTTTSAGWLGYGDEQLRQLCRDALAEGWTHSRSKWRGSR
jgi:L-fuconate dehydratase